MPISGVSSATSAPLLQAYRLGPRGVEAPGAAEGPGALRPAQAIAGREDARPEDAASKGAEGRPSKDEAARLLALDPRDPRSLVGASSNSGPGATAAREAPSPVAGARGSSPEALALEAAARRGAEDKRTESEARRRDAGERLAQLVGEKGSLERKRAEGGQSRADEVASMVSQLKSRDSEVRAHEAAHMAAGGRYVTGGASYSYQKGPDGVQYAVGGEVGIDTSSVPGKPEETAQKMRTIRAAALAPTDPSSADVSVASAAAQAESQALAEIARSRTEELAGRYELESRAGDRDRAARGLDMVA